MKIKENVKLLQYLKGREQGIITGLKLMPFLSLSKERF
jgi:hypothetical protein